MGLEAYCKIFKGTARGIFEPVIINRERTLAIEGDVHCERFFSGLNFRIWRSMFGVQA